MTTGSAAVSVPPPVVPPRGLAGLLEGYDASKLLDTSQFPPSQVYLNVYDLGDNDTINRINAVSTGNNNMLLGGMFHAGVQVYCKEWCYGLTVAGTGVAAIVPRAHSQHKYRTTVPLSATALSEQEVASLIERMSSEWRGDEYDLLHRNCLNFANALSQELGVGRIPGWVDRAPRAASEIEVAYRTAAMGAQEVVGSVASVLPEGAPALPANAEDAQRQAGEAMETVRLEAQKALERAQSESSRLASAAQAQAQELVDAAQPLAAQAVEAAQTQAEELRQAAEPIVADCVAEVEAMRQDIQSQAKRLSLQAQELMQEDVAVQARELAEKTQAQARSLGSSLWGRAQAAWAAAEATATAAAAEVEKAVAEPIGQPPQGGQGGQGAWSNNWESTLGGLLGNLGATLEVPFGQDGLRCPQGHGLRPWQARAGTCDGCAREVKDGEQVMDCRLCDFYYCGNCVQALEGPPMSPVPVEAPSLPVTPVPVQKATSPASTSDSVEAPSANSGSPAKPAERFSLSPRSGEADEEEDDQE